MEQRLESERAQRFESLVGRMEAGIRDRAPFEVGKQDVEVLRVTFSASGIEFNIGNVERERLLHGVQFRAKVRLDEKGDVKGVA